MPFDTWLVFLITCVGIAVVPGPNAFLALSHGALHGRKMALYTIAGGVSGLSLVMGVFVLGVGAIIQSSATILTFLKAFGAVYLIWIGYNLWRPDALTMDIENLAHPSGGAMFTQGLFAALSNPKALLLYTAFLPPFINPEANLLIQALIIALTYAVVEFCVEFLVAVAAHIVKPWLAKAGKRFNMACGGFFITFGIMIPFQ
ncbi:LysE family translocator [Maribrevibacterium harenarium]|uniref:LysE family translocator n=1 Tax=Maribrevibacterium harenarium TaxID=2589817 RepID=A0A501WJ05_9GAMM|nr:LysE family translocator [Maribrevibacterium harenarium]TPE49479.1 LysE family translocator [Maribrevibacterium harenarium]